MFILLAVLLQVEFIMSQSFDREIGTINAFVGETTTLVCDLRNVYDNEYIVWYHTDRLQCISYNRDFVSDIPYYIMRRFRVACGNREEDMCSLTITELTLEDNGLYQCGVGYTDSRNEFHVNWLLAGTLNVLTGTPPSAESPLCSIYTSQNGEYIAPSVGQIYSIGDNIFLQCSVTGAVPKPSIIWIRNGTAISVSAKGLTIVHQFILTREDIGVMFTCMMTHPLIDGSRSCSVTPLPYTQFRSTSSPPKTLDMSTLTPPKPMKNSTDKFTTIKSQPVASSSGKQSFLVPALATSVVILLVIIILVVILLIWRKKFQKSAIPRRLDYNMTFDRVDCSITPDYAAVNAPDSIDKMLRLNNQKSNLEASGEAHEQNQHLLKKKQNIPIVQNGANFPTYAKADRNLEKNNAVLQMQLEQNATLYDNLPNYEYEDDEVCCTPDDNATTSNGHAGLMYAELDLPTSEEADSPRRPRTNDATIYAKIEGTL